MYYYVTNLQGDVIALLDTSGNVVVQYTYDAWGKILSTTGSLATTLGIHNPLRYRGYVYDAETKLYYLQSRYYDPTTGRFLNADALVSTGQGILGNNMFAYCRNNPVYRKDITGTADVIARDDGELLSNDDLDNRKGGNAGSRFSSHFGRGNGSGKPWYSVVESTKAYNATKGLKFDQYQSYEEVLSKLAQGDGSGLNIHGSKGGFWSADISGFGKGRGNGRILFEIYDGFIYIIELTVKHFKK